MIDSFSVLLYAMHACGRACNSDLTWSVPAHNRISLCYQYSNVPPLRYYCTGEYRACSTTMPPTTAEAESSSSANHPVTRLFVCLLTYCTVRGTDGISAHCPKEVPCPRRPPRLLMA